MTASAQQCESKDKCEGQKVNGLWNSFYDQAMKVELENGKRFLANWRYSLKEYVQSEPFRTGARGISDVQIDDYDKFYSQCDRTMIGFIQDMSTPSTMTDHNVACFYANKNSAEGEIKNNLVQREKDEAKRKEDEEEKKADKENVQTHSDIKIVKDEQLIQIESQMEGKSKELSGTKLQQRKKGKKSFRRNPLLDHAPSDVTDLEITAINSQKLSWTANVCML